MANPAGNDFHVKAGSTQATPQGTVIAAQKPCRRTEMNSDPLVMRFVGEPITREASDPSHHAKP